MIFLHSVWDTFCASLNQRSIPASDLMKEQSSHFLVLKHDVETNVKKAFRIAEIEHKYDHRGSYYVQAYLLKDRKNIALLQQMQAMGHEISYHYDVLDSCKGDMDLAMQEYADNVALFESNGFPVETVCQHGNPVVERRGYSSNRDFYRNERVQAAYPHTADIMVDFPAKANVKYLYFSDAGRQFQLIYDPLENDRIPSDDKNTKVGTMEELAAYAERENCIISIHPHRWSRSKMLYWIRGAAFKVIRQTAKLMLKIPFMRKLMGRYFYLAKKI